MDNINTRTAMILKHGVWTNIHPLEIKEGDIFRMFEDDGEPIYDKSGDMDMVAIEDAYEDENGIYTVYTEEGEDYNDEI